MSTTSSSGHSQPTTSSSALWSSTSCVMLACTMLMAALWMSTLPTVHSAYPIPMTENRSIALASSIASIRHIMARGTPTASASPSSRPSVKSATSPSPIPTKATDIASWLLPTANLPAILQDGCERHTSTGIRVTGVISVVKRSMVLLYEYQKFLCSETRVSPQRNSSPIA